ncbi:winged helix-turn-helix transcriptional regulator [Catenulispora pinisilvae]|uniref:winged helix-turn-helix transcriptional regulator n=1 Tax=Catenulispora pinisilvae TaxID=2705253 RepID=UPI002B26F9EB|nr:winged helix-turn-helix transcriptional regulator [Catenulispora pinisilvae]
MGGGLGQHDRHGQADPGADKRPYREDGGRTRDEYVLTDMGRDLFPVIVALMQWGDKYLQDGTGPLHYLDHEAGVPVHVEVRSETGDAVELEQISVRRNPAWSAPKAPKTQASESVG